MIFLAIDTSGQEAGAAIVDKYITIGEIRLNARTGEKTWTHSEILMPGVEQLFSLVRLSPSCVDYVAYACGPGSFTGLRIGAAVALGMARALGKPAIPVPTLDAMAFNLFRGGGAATIIPMLDARRGQVYTAFYERDADGQIERVSEHMALSAQDVLKEIPPENRQPIIFLGDGAGVNKELLLEGIPGAIFASPNNNRQRAASVGVWAAEQINAGVVFPDKVDLLYVRAPQAVREAAARGGGI